jgi:hypothetical protein
MYISARLAVQADANGFPVSLGHDYHGRNIVLKSLNSIGFSAETSFTCPKGALVRLRLPCLGVALARVTKVRRGTVEGEFINPVNPAQLAKVLGVAAAVQPAFA